MHPDGIAPSEDEQIKRRMEELEGELAAEELYTVMGEEVWRFTSTRNPTCNEEDSHMANIKDVYKGGNSLKAEDLKGRAHLLTIGEVRLQKFDEGAKLVIAFSGRDKTLVCNKTNAQMIASKLGDDYDRWAGNEIEVYPDKTQFNGSLVDCIRVRFPIPHAAADDTPIPF